MASLLIHKWTIVLLQLAHHQTVLFPSIGIKPLQAAAVGNVAVVSVAERYNQYSKRKYDDLLAKADQTIVLSENYYTRCFLDRDDFLVENSSMIVAYYDGRNRGGTFYTMNQAERHQVPVVNLY